MNKVFIVSVLAIVVAGVVVAQDAQTGQEGQEGQTVPPGYDGAYGGYGSGMDAYNNAMKNAYGWATKYAEGIDEKIFINAGIGLAMNQHPETDMAIPPLSASVDFKLPVKLPITLGGMFIFSQWKFSMTIPLAGDFESTWSYIAIAARALYHFSFLKNLDTYAGLRLGYMIQTMSEETEGYGPSPEILIHLTAGARYFFTKNIGAYLEAGMGFGASFNPQSVSVGLAVKR